MPAGTNLSERESVGAVSTRAPTSPLCPHVPQPYLALCQWVDDGVNRDFYLAVESCKSPKTHSRGNLKMMSELITEQAPYLYSYYTIQSTYVLRYAWVKRWASDPAPALCQLSAQRPKCKSKLPSSRIIMIFSAAPVSDSWHSQTFEPSLTRTRDRRFSLHSDIARATKLCRQCRNYRPWS